MVQSRPFNRLFQHPARRYRDGRRRVLFVGPGEKIVLRTWEGDACFVWRRFRSSNGQAGINCAFFRNESAHHSSELIRQADAIADVVWPGLRHYTYVNPSRIRSTNPGYCFLCAGWTRAGRTQGGLIILERIMKETTNEPAVHRPDCGP